MEHKSKATESIKDFFTRYTKYLTDGNIDGLADIYNYPSLAVSGSNCLAITDPKQTREFFKQGRERYHAQDIHAVRAREIKTEIEGSGVWVGHLILENQDKSGKAVGEERNAYQVVTLPDGTRRIAVSTPLDADQSEQ